jgi:hypothetical protein
MIASGAVRRNPYSCPPIGHAADAEILLVRRAGGEDPNMTRTPARPDLQAHHNAMRLDPPVLVKELRELLGARLVAYLGGDK